MINGDNAEWLADRPYYAEIPKHVLLLPDGARRYARKQGIEKQAYQTAQKNCQDFWDLCFNEFGIQEASIFFLRPESFEMQRRTEENLQSILLAGNSLAETLLQGESRLDLSRVYFDTVTLAAKHWMDMPDRVINSPVLKELWERLTENLARLKRMPSEGKKKANLLINYSGKDEIDQAIAGKGLQITNPVGLLIRTGDGLRMSDCPLYALSQAHCYLIQKYFPLVNREDFSEALSKYYKRERK